MTFETFDQTDFWKIFRFLEDFQIFGRFSDFWKIFRFLGDIRIFGRSSDFLKKMRKRKAAFDTEHPTIRKISVSAPALLVVVLFMYWVVWIIMKWFD